MQVNIETVAAHTLFIPGPNASKASLVLSRIRDLAAEAHGALRYADDADIDTVKLDVCEEYLHKITRPMRHGQREHTRAFVAEVQARELGLHTSEESPDEHSPEHSP